MSPLGKPAETLRSAVASLSGAGIEPVAVSRLYRTPAFPAGSGPDYVNAALTARSALGPEPLLARLHEIEARMGRERHERWGPRSLDLDLLAVEGRVLPDATTVRGWIELNPELQRTRAPEELILPHPRLQDRAFVLVPLAEVAPDWRHPILGKTVADMLAELPEAEKIAVKPL